MNGGAADLSPPTGVFRDLPSLTGLWDLNQRTDKRALPSQDAGLCVLLFEITAGPFYPLFSFGHPPRSHTCRQRLPVLMRAQGGDRGRGGLQTGEHSRPAPRPAGPRPAAQPRRRLLASLSWGEGCCSSGQAPSRSCSCSPRRFLPAVLSLTHLPDGAQGRPPPPRAHAHTLPCPCSVL